MASKKGFKSSARSKRKAKRKKIEFLNLLPFSTEKYIHASIKGIIKKRLLLTRRDNPMAIPLNNHKSILFLSRFLRSKNSERIIRNIPRETFWMEVEKKTKGP